MTNDPHYKYDIFISYNQIDEAWAKQLATLLEREIWQGKSLGCSSLPGILNPESQSLSGLSMLCRAVAKSG